MSWPRTIRDEAARALRAPASWLGLIGALLLAGGWLAGPVGPALPGRRIHPLPSLRSGQPVRGASSLLEDRRGLLWVGSASGVRVCPLDASGPAWSPTGLPPGPVTALTQGSDGRVWLAGPGGLYVQDGATLTLARSVSGDLIYLGFDPKGRLWGAARQGGPFMTYTQRDTPLLHPAGFPSKARVDDMLLGPEGVVWVLTGEGLFQILEPGLHQVTADPPGSCPVRRLALGPDGHIRTAGPKGLCRVVLLGSSPQIHLRPAYRLPAEDFEIRDLQSGRQATGWLATDKGLLLLQPGQPAAWIDERLGLPSKDVRVMERGSQERLWIGTAGGVAWLRDQDMEELRGQSLLQAELDRWMGPLAGSLVAAGLLLGLVLVLAVPPTRAGRDRSTLGAALLGGAAALMSLGWSSGVVAYFGQAQAGGLVRVAGAQMLLGLCPALVSQALLLRGEQAEPQWRRAVLLLAFLVLAMTAGLGPLALLLRLLHAQWAGLVVPFAVALWGALSIAVSGLGPVLLLVAPPGPGPGPRPAKSGARTIRPEVCAGVLSLAEDNDGALDLARLREQGGLSRNQARAVLLGLRRAGIARETIQAGSKKQHPRRQEGGKGMRGHVPSLKIDGLQAELLLALVADPDADVEHRPAARKGRVAQRRSALAKAVAVLLSLQGLLGLVVAQSWGWGMISFSLAGAALWAAMATSKRAKRRSRDASDHRVLAALAPTSAPLTPEILALARGLEADEAASWLTRLEQEGRLRRVAGKGYPRGD